MGVGGSLPKRGSRAYSESVSDPRTSYVEPEVCSLDSVENTEDAKDIEGGGKVGRVGEGVLVISTGPCTVTVGTGGELVEAVELLGLSLLERMAFAALAELMAAASVLNGAGFDCLGLSEASVGAGEGFLGVEFPVLLRLEMIAVAALAELMAAASVLNGGGFDCLC